MKRKMYIFIPIRRSLKSAAVLLLIAALMSCGEIFDWETGQVQNVDDLYFPQSSLTLIEGDSVVLSVSTSPDDIHPALFWQSDDNEVAYFRDSLLFCAAAGTTMVRVSAPQVALSDSCELTVIPQWHVDYHQYEYDMQVYCSVQVRQEAFNPEHLLVGAFCGSELRGVALPMSDYDRPYLSLRIYSNQQRGETITFRCYHFGEGGLTEDFPQSLTFDATQKAVGTLSNLYQLSIQ